MLTLYILTLCCSTWTWLTLSSYLTLSKSLEPGFLSLGNGLNFTASFACLIGLHGRYKIIMYLIKCKRL